MELNELFTLAALCALGLAYANFRTASPVLAIFSRWARWLFIAFSLAYVAQLLEWSTRPFWVLVASGFLVWFLIETVYNWVAISALSQSEIPLFPEYRINDGGGEWPNQKRVIGLREWLRQNQYSGVAALKAGIDEFNELRLSVYQSADGRTRIQILFIPQRRGSVSECFILTSQAEDGRRLITDNNFLPFGGFYPENWYICRKPWMRSLKRLERFHRRRMQKLDTDCVTWEIDVMEDLNDHQKDMERINTDLGFLFPRHLRDDYGKITFEGRYRVWKELWLLSYFGISQNY